MTTIASTGSGLSDAEHNAQLRRAVVAGTVGTIIEAYDFLLYVQVAPLVFATLFFPGSDRLVGTLQAQQHELPVPLHSLYLRPWQLPLDFRGIVYEVGLPEFHAQHAAPGKLPLQSPRKRFHFRQFWHLNPKRKRPKLSSLLSVLFTLCTLC